MRRRFLTTAAVAAVVLTSGLTGTAFAAFSPPTDLQSRFAVLRHAPAAAIPDAVTDFARWANNKGSGIPVDVQRTRRVPGPDGGYWDVIPGDTGLCFYNEDRGVGGCAASAAAADGRLAVTLVRPASSGDLKVPTDTQRLQIGLLPDDAIAASAKTRTGGVTLSAKPNASGLYQLAATEALDSATVHRAGKPAVRIASGSGKWRTNSPSVRAKDATCSCPYYDSAPPNHYWTDYQYWYNQYVAGNYSTLGSIDVVSRDVSSARLCGAAQNTYPGGLVAGWWICINGGNGVWASAYEDYQANNIRRAVGTAETYVANGRVRQYYYALA